MIYVYLMCVVDIFHTHLEGWFPYWSSVMIRGHQMDTERILISHWLIAQILGLSLLKEMRSASLIGRELESLVPSLVETRTWNVSLSLVRSLNCWSQSWPLLVPELATVRPRVGQAAVYVM